MDRRRNKIMRTTSLSNLVAQKTNWKNLPTKAIRVPKCFASKLVEIAKMWDENNSISSDINYNNESMKQAISILEQSLKLPANKGGAIKKEIKKVLALLEKDNKS